MPAGSDSRHAQPSGVGALNHTHFSPHLLTTTSHNQPQLPNGEKSQMSLWRNGFHNYRQLSTTE